VKCEPREAAVIFDLDGTLVDSAPDITASMAFALEELRQPDRSESLMTSFIGNGAGRLIHRSLTGDWEGIADPDLFAQTSEIFFTHYAANVCRRSTLYPAVTKTLEELKDYGFQLACVTNKPAEFTEPLIVKLGLKDYFTVTLSGDSLANKKPAPDQLLHVVATCGVTAQNSTMIGDTVTDIQAARNANMRAICVSYGYGNKAAIAAHSPFAVVDSIDQIIDIILSSVPVSLRSQAAKL
jgi:phosphoglycolate phosphatase